MTIIFISNLLKLLQLHLQSLLLKNQNVIISPLYLNYSSIALLSN